MRTFTTTTLKVGLVGENPHDTDALKVLLERQYGGRIQCVALGRRITGDKLADKSAHFLKILAAAYLKARPDIVIISRDLDALESDAAKRAARQQEFDRFNPHVGGNALFLLHIYELEALIATQPQVVRDYYQVTYNPQSDVMRIEDPKGKLRTATQKSKRKPPYEPAHAAELLEKANYEHLLKRCRYFATFDALFRDRLTAA